MITLYHNLRLCVILHDNKGYINMVSQKSRTTQAFQVFHHDISFHFLHVRS